MPGRAAAGAAVAVAKRQPGQRPWRRALAWLAFLAPFFYLSYGGANYLASLRENVPSIVFEWEGNIPFLAWTIFPYWSINVFYGLSLLLSRTRHELDRHGLRLLTAQVLAVSCFLAAPLAFSLAQPAADGVAGGLFTALRSFDKPFNQAPSLHIALAVILWDLYRRLLTARWAKWILHAWTLLICASVLTTYQHHFFDIPTGVLLGLLCVWAWPLERRVPPWKGWRWTRDPKRIRIAVAYALGAAAFAVSALHWQGAALWLFWPTIALLMVALNYLVLGARGFGKDRFHGTPWAMRWLLLPYRWMAWLNSRWWTFRQTTAVPVAPDVWLGRVPGAHAAVPWRSAVDLTAELDSPHCVPTIHLPAIDLVQPTPAWLLRVARAIERQRARHGSVIAFCALGYSRSAAAVATWLLLTGRARHVEEAIQSVRNARPNVVLGPVHARAIAGAWAMVGGDAGQ